MPAARHHSLRWRLAFGFGLLLAAIGIGGRCVHYHLTVELLARDLDAQLRARLGVLEARQRMAREPGEIREQLAGAVRLESDRRPSLLLRLFMPAEAHSGIADSNLELFAGIWDADGRLVASADLPPGVSWEEHESTKAGRVWTDRDGGVRLAACRDQTGRLLLVGTSLEVLRAAERQAQTFYVATLVIVLPLLLAALWLLLDRLLRPLRAITRTADRIRSGFFDERIDLTVADAEIAGLAATINAMLDRLAEVRDKQSRFNADFAHEVLGPVHAILLEADAALLHEPTGECAARMTAIRSRADRIETLCESLLSYSRSLAIGTADGRAIDLEPVVDLAVEQVAQAAAGRGVTIDNRVGSIVARGHPDLLQQVFTNLLTNAIAHSPPDTAVRVEAVADRDGPAIRVVDRGPGVSEQDVARIFDRFVPGLPAAPATSRSHGIGLSLSREIMRSHGGDLDVLPTPGGGATFVARFPAVPDAGRAGAEPVSTRRGGASPGHPER